MMQLLDPSSAAAAIFELIVIVTHSLASRLESYNVSHLWRMAIRAVTTHVSKRIKIVTLRSTNLSRGVRRQNHDTTSCPGPAI